MLASGVWRLCETPRRKSSFASSSSTQPPVLVLDPRVQLGVADRRADLDREQLEQVLVGALPAAGRRQVPGRDAEHLARGGELAPGPGSARRGRPPRSGSRAGRRAAARSRSSRTRLAPASADRPAIASGRSWSSIDSSATRIRRSSRVAPLEVARQPVVAVGEAAELVVAGQLERRARGRPPTPGRRTRRSPAAAPRGRPRARPPAARRTRPRPRSRAAGRGTRSCRCPIARSRAARRCRTRRAAGPRPRRARGSAASGSRGRSRDSRGGSSARRRRGRRPPPSPRPRRAAAAASVAACRSAGAVGSRHDSAGSPALDEPVADAPHREQVDGLVRDRARPSGAAGASSPRRSSGRRPRCRPSRGRGASRWSRSGRGSRRGRTAAATRSASATPSRRRRSPRAGGARATGSARGPAAGAAPGRRAGAAPA